MVARRARSNAQILPPAVSLARSSASSRLLNSLLGEPPILPTQNSRSCALASGRSFQKVVGSAKSQLRSEAVRTPAGEGAGLFRDLARRSMLAEVAASSPHAPVPTAGAHFVPLLRGFPLFGDSQTPGREHEARVTELISYDLIIVVPKRIAGPSRVPLV